MSWVVHKPQSSFRGILNSLPILLSVSSDLGIDMNLPSVSPFFRRALSHFPTRAVSRQILWASRLCAIPTNSTVANADGISTTTPRSPHPRSATGGFLPQSTGQALTLALSSFWEICKHPSGARTDINRLMNRASYSRDLEPHTERTLSVCTDASSTRHLIKAVTIPVEGRGYCIQCRGWCSCCFRQISAGCRVDIISIGVIISRDCD
jgi:hypothetical protein